MPKKYDVVQLIQKGKYKDALTGTTYTLPAGSAGTIVEVYSQKGLPKAFEIEFKDVKGTEVVTTVLASDVSTPAKPAQNVVSLAGKLQSPKKTAAKAAKRASIKKPSARKKVRAEG